MCHEELRFDALQLKLGYRIFGLVGVLDCAHELVAGEGEFDEAVLALPEGHTVVLAVTLDWNLPIGGRPHGAGDLVAVLRQVHMDFLRLAGSAAWQGVDDAAFPLAGEVGGGEGCGKNEEAKRSFPEDSHRYLDTSVERLVPDSLDRMRRDALGT